MQKSILLYWAAIRYCRDQIRSNNINDSLLLLNPDILPDIPTLKRLLIELAFSTTYSNWFLEDEKVDKDNFYNFIEVFDIYTANPEPILYYRKLTFEEAKTIVKKAIQRWKIKKDYWYPLRERKEGDPFLIALNSEEFNEHVTGEDFKKIFKKRKISRIVEFSFESENFYLSVEDWAPDYGSEVFWTSESCEWIIYNSHENSITLGGWMIEEIYKIWPELEKHFWLGC